MMREQVCIVLNEREQSKAKVAESLEARLQSLNITTSRLEIDRNIEKIVLQKLPRVLILDYLLGDYSTGLDILSLIQEIEESKRPKVFFLTDEPSVPVAVEAIKLGALDFLEIDNPQSLSKLISEVENALRSMPAAPRSLSRCHTALDDLVANTKSSLMLHQQIKALALKAAPIVVIWGPPGSGLTTLAHALHLERHSESFCRYLRLSAFNGALAEALGTPPGFFGLRLGHDLSLIIEDAEEDDGELLTIVTEGRERLWGAKNPGGVGSFLTITTREEQTARAWQRLAYAEILKVPSLNEREQDIPPLVQRFVREAEELCGSKIKPLDATTVSWLCSQTWPQNIRQLHSIVVDSAITCTLSATSPREQIEERLELWSELHANLNATQKPDALVAACSLERANFNYRIAAARLGCSVTTLSEILRNGHR